MDKFLLSGLLYLVKMCRIAEVNMSQLAIITETKLVMDRRRVRANISRKAKDESRNQLMGTLIIYSLFGLLMAILVFSSANSVLSMILLHAYLLFMMSMTLITDFSAVLLDTTDNQVILPRPVNGKTLFLARLLHILVYLLQFIIALGLFPLIAIVITLGIKAAIASVFTFLLTVALAVFFTYIMYIFILTFSNEQKVKDIVGYFQIFLTILFSAGYQVIPRFIDYEAINRTFTLHWYSYLLPPVWMSMTIESFQRLIFDGKHLLMIFAAFLIPVFTFWIMIKYLAPAFSRKLAVLQNDPVSKKMHRSGKSAFRFSAFFSGLTCKLPIEKAGFDLVWKTTGRERTFKMQFYPGIGYILIFVFLIIFKNGRALSETWQQLPTTRSFLWLIYLPMFTVSSSIRLIHSSEQFMASWVYFSTPIKYPGQLLSGALKALFTKFFVPALLLMYIFAWYVWGIDITDDFILGLCNSLILFCFFEIVTDHYLPFSRQQNISDQTGRFILVLAQFAVVAVLVGLHYLALQVNYLVILLAPVSATVAYFMFKKIQGLRWINMKI